MNGTTPAGTEHHAWLVIEYCGTPFRGWSRQDGHATIEGELLAAMRARFIQCHSLRCAGRTDAGVHATQQVASLTYSGRVAPNRVGASLNQVLPATIAVVASGAADATFDARAEALSRAYRYRVLTRAARSPTRTGHVLHHPRALDLDLLQEAGAAICGQHDFTAFTPSQTRHSYFLRTVLQSSWQQHGDELVYSIRANAFLRHMVRVLVGTMLAVGRGDRPLEQFVALLDGATRTDAFVTAAPHALTLVDVEFPVGTGPPRIIGHDS